MEKLNNNKYTFSSDHQLMEKKKVLRGDLIKFINRSIGTYKLLGRKQ